MTDTTSIKAPLEITFRGVDEIIAYACPECGTIVTPNSFSGDMVATKEYAATHCVFSCGECRAPMEKKSSLCVICWTAKQDGKEVARFERATKINEAYYNDPVYWEDHEGGMGEGYFVNVDEVRDYCETNDIPLPAYVWACSPVKLEISVDSILEEAFRGHYESARDSLDENAEKKLETFLNAWCEEQDIKSWEVSYALVIELDQPKEEEHGATGGREGTG